MKFTMAKTCVLLGTLTPTWMPGQSSGSPVVKDFVAGGKVEITLESGGYNIQPSADNRIRVRWNEASGRGVKVQMATHEKSAEIKVGNTPNNFHATIEVPPQTELRIRLTAGALTVSGIRGDKDIESNAGDVIVDVGKNSDWEEVDASVTAGDLSAPAFATSKGGLFRSLHWKGHGKYRLHVSLTAGSLKLRTG
ncbi:MAG TPA: hypothetical protein VKH81_17650 [Candidatus Angelobacter sp.]|nr:hypothetical protein [Candidatus Angelobacter sp.]